MSSIVEPHHKKLVDQIPPEQYKGYLLEFVALYIMQNGSAGLCSRFPGLAKWYSDPPLGMPAGAWTYPQNRPGTVTLGSANPRDAEAAK